MRQNGFYVSLRKTKEIEIDESSHALPPDHGPFQEYQVADYFCPDEWSKDGVFVEVKEGEPLWIGLQYNPLCACIPSIQRVNPITGDPADLTNGLKKDPKQNYLVLPKQLWIDGYVNEGKVYQFKVTKAGEALAVNEYVLPENMRDSHALGFAFFLPKNPVVEDRSPPSLATLNWSSGASITKLHSKCCSGNHPKRLRNRRCSSGYMKSWTYGGGASEITNSAMPAQEQFTSGPVLMGDSAVESNYCTTQSFDRLSSYDSEIVNEIDSRQYDQASMGAGGRITQEIKTDENSVDFYKDEPAAILTIYLALPEQFQSIMKRGKRQDATRKDKHINSGSFGGVPIPLFKVEA